MKSTFAVLALSVSLIIGGGIVSSVEGESTSISLSELTTSLQSNQAYLFYMYSSNEGHFLLDPIAEFENVIFVERGEFLFVETETLHHGTKLIGTFADDALWELTGLELVEN